MWHQIPLTILWEEQGSCWVFSVIWANWMESFDATRTIRNFLEIKNFNHQFPFCRNWLITSIFFFSQISIVLLGWPNMVKWNIIISAAQMLRISDRSPHTQLQYQLLYSAFWKGGSWDLQCFQNASFVIFGCKGRPPKKMFTYGHHPKRGGRDWPIVLLYFFHTFNCGSIIKYSWKIKKIKMSLASRLSRAIN